MGLEGDEEMNSDDKLPEHLRRGQAASKKLADAFRRMATSCTLAAIDIAEMAAAAHPKGAEARRSEEIADGAIARAKRQAGDQPG